MTARLEDLARGALIVGVVPGETVTVVDVRWFGTSAIELTYKRPDGSAANRLLYRDDEEDLSVAVEGRPWGFRGDGGLFRLMAEAKRFELAHLFDPYLAVTSAAVEPLPHQITAVYEAMLPRQPLRFLLADDPGAGKTIMTGLLIRELQARGDLRRCLIVTPGSLVEQWQQELDEKFNVSFKILTREGVEASRTGNPFAEEDLLIARLDMMSRDEDLQEKLSQTDWDLIVFDEAHKLSATLSLMEVHRTKRRIFAEFARELTRHFLLLTATPHNGKEADFQLFLSLLDPDRFEGHQRTANEATPARGDTSDLMRRLMKEHLVRFDGTALFPPRFAHVVPFKLSDAEASLYEMVTEYVRTEMNRAERLKREGEGQRGSVVGFALTVLQRRLASSPEAIFQSLRRRRERLERRLEDEALLRRGAGGRHSDSDLGAIPEAAIEDAESDEATAEEIERLEDAVVDLASASSTMDELRYEIDRLRELEAQAARLRELRTDRKWNELAGLMSESPEMRDGGGGRRKIVVFTEHRDTLNYLAARLRQLLGDDSSVVEIHGGMPREVRRRQESLFKNDPHVTVLVATDAAGEGINLQRAHLMVNYDLPWNPNRLEQRFGRIHRIGQTEACHLWNLVATETREGDVYGTLLQKIEEETAALGGQVFDVLGSVEFGDRTLRDLLIEAIRAADAPEARQRMRQVVDTALDRGHLEQLLAERALAADTLDTSRITSVREEMRRSAVMRLQPHAVRLFFVEALRRLGGQIIEREPGRFEVRHVPVSVRESARSRSLRLVLPGYERVVFDKDLVAPPGLPLAEMISPGHALFDATLALLLEKHGELLRTGATLVDREDTGDEPRLLLFVEHSIVDQRPSANGRQRRVSQRLQFVELSRDGAPEAAGPSPFLDYHPIASDEADMVDRALSEQPWLASRLIEERAIAFAIEHLSRPHLAEVRARIDKRVKTTAAAVTERLRHEIAHWTARADELERKELAGQIPRLNSAKARGRAQELSDRLQRRLLDLERERQVSSLPPVVVGGAIVVPQGLIDRIDGVVPAADNAEAVRAMFDLLARREETTGMLVSDVRGMRLGYDAETRGAEGMRFIKLTAEGLDPIPVTVNELRACLNAGDAYLVAHPDANGSGIVLRGVTPPEASTFAETTAWIQLGARLAV